MHVNKTAGEIARVEAIQRSQSAASATSAPSAGSPQAPESAAATRRGDAVQISDAGLALSGTSAAGASRVSSLDPGRVDALRAKILNGAYDSLQMADQVARAVVRSGDL